MRGETDARHNCYDRSEVTSHPNASDIITGRLTYWKRCVCSFCDVSTHHRQPNAPRWFFFQFSSSLLQRLGGCRLLSQEIVMCLRLRVGFSVGFSVSEDPSLVRNPELASLWYARQTSSSRWKRGNWPLFPPRGNHAEYLWSKPKRQESCRLAGSCCTAASSNLTPGFIESRVTGNHRLSLFLFFFLQRSKVETFNLKISRWRRRESIAFPFLFSFSFSPTPQLICFWTFSVPPQSNGMLKLVELYSSQEQTRAGLTVRHR